MIRALLLAFSFLVLVPQFSQAGCGECGFPMAKLYGTWQTSDNVLIVKQRARNGNTVIVDVALLDSRTRQIVAQGHGVGNINNTDLRVQLLFANGARKIFMISAQGSLIRVNLGSKPILGQRCPNASQCKDFKFVPNSIFDSKIDFFGQHPDPLALTPSDFR